MATDFSSRPKPAVLKRFANLDIDGVDKPERPPKPAAAARPGPPVVRNEARPVRNEARPNAERPTSGDADLRDFEVLADELNANATMAREAPPVPRTRFNMPMPSGPASDFRSQRAAELRSSRPPDPRFLPPPPPSRSPSVDRTLQPPAVERTPPAMVREIIAYERARREQSRRPPVNEAVGNNFAGFDRGPGVNARLWDLPRNPPPRVESDEEALEELAALAGLMPGVMTVEVDLTRRQRARTERFAATGRAQPFELTAMAARQIQLMSWEAGVPGAALRILTADSPGLGRPELDFAFDEQREPDDLVFECHGVTIVVDPGTLRWVAGRRIGWHEVPGSEGFRIL